MKPCFEKIARQSKIALASWALALAAVLLLMIGGVVAYLSTRTGAVTNTFSADTADVPSVTETFVDNLIKTDVQVNVGNPAYSVYVRAAVVVTWKDENGGVLGRTPAAGTDYTISFNETDWFQGDDGFYYLKTPVIPANSNLTPVLINICKPNSGQIPDGYGLNVEIIAQTIQALGTTDADHTPAVRDAWGVTVLEDGTLAPAT